MNKLIGFTLIEVLVASLLIMLGVTGYVTLQSEYVLADAKLNLRSRALVLAQQKLTDLAYFQQLMVNANATSYQGIGNNVGGEIASGEKIIQLSTANNLHSYYLSWQVDDYYYVDTNYDNIADAWVKSGQAFYPTSLPLLPDLKSIKVSVSWLDHNANNKQVVMLGSVAPIALTQSFQAKSRTSSALASL